MKLRNAFVKKLKRYRKKNEQKIGYIFYIFNSKFYSVIEGNVRKFKEIAQSFSNLHILFLYLDNRDFGNK